jgi:formate hydrogenlyase subunit 3/multisubunit Na+/H+ antiporter MnhD subunit
MVTSLLHPLNIFILGLGGGFLIPLLNRLGPRWVSAALVLALSGMVLISGVALVQFWNGAGPVEILTGGSAPPYAIGLRLGAAECVFTFGVSLFALMGAIHFVREKYATVLLYLILVMGIQGMVMTGDLFNLFVFLEIVSVATYGLLMRQDKPSALSAAFKFLIATVIASSFFLLGTVLLYSVAGTLAIDDLVSRRGDIKGPIAFAALMFLLACILIELKPFPANGWGLDVYETARSSVAALVSVGVSAGVFYALVKLLALFEGQLEVIAALGTITFLFSNLIGLQQTSAQRLLGYSSIAQMGLLTIALAMLTHLKAEAAIPLVVAGLFVNHLFAKAGLFWLAGYVGRERIADWPSLCTRPAVLAVFGILVAAVAGLPPFPGFWAKWQLTLSLAAGERYVWIVFVLLGSLLEAAYLFRWFGRTVHAGAPADSAERGRAELIPVFGAALILVLAGCFAAHLSGVSSWTFVPLGGGLVLYALDGLPGRAKCLLTLAVVAAGGGWLVQDLSDLNRLFAILLLVGSLALTVAFLNRGDRRRGFFPLLAVMLLSLPALSRASTSLEFFFVWELITLSSYLLVLHGRHAERHALRYLLFSLVSAFFLLGGFAVANAVNGTTALSVLREAGSANSTAFVLIAVGLLIKAGAAGVHVWLPGTYAEADDDMSAMMSAVISKVAILGLLVGTYIAVRSEADLGFARVLGWIGMLTTLVGAMLAVRQDDIKRMLAYSSMSQLGYIVTAIALLSHLGWVTALYLTANHLMVKGVLFLVAAAVILRTGTRTLSDLGGLARTMPVSFATAAFAIVAMSGLPPLAGFGGKWILLSAMMDKGWYGPIVMGLLATFVGFLYMARFIQAVFLGGKPQAYRGMAEPSVALLVPQFLFVAGILVMSFWPKLLIEPISAAIDPYFASTLVWRGMSLKMIYAYWDPVPAMAFAVAVSAILFAIFWLLQRGGWTRSSGMRPMAGAKASSAGFDVFCRMVFTALTPPLASGFWDRVSALTVLAGGQVRLLYTGNGQTYGLYILYYFVVLYAACGGLEHILGAR